MSFLNKNFFIKFFIVDIVFFLVFYFTFIFTFPIKEIAKSNKALINQKTGKIIKYKDISLGLDLSINIKNLEIITISENVNTSKKKNNKNKAAIKTDKKVQKPKTLKLIVKSLSIKPKIMDMILSKRTNIDFSAELMDGEINGNFSVVEDKKRINKSKKTKNITRRKLEKNEISLSLESIDLSKISKYLELKLPYSGKLTGDIETVFSTRRGKPVISYLSLELDMKNGKLGPGKVKAVGSYATVDQIKLGNFEIKGKTAKNSSRFKFEPLKIDSSDIEASLDGTITFSRSIMPNLRLKFKFTEQLLKASRKIKTVASLINNMKRKDGSFGVKLTGTLKHLRQRPWKR